MPTLKIEFVTTDPTGVRRVRDDNWSGQALLCSKKQIEAAMQGDVFDVSGVYILVGQSELKTDSGGFRFQDSIYIGQADSVRDRLQSHLKHKKFWREAIVFVRHPEALHAGNIRYLESRLIQLAMDAGNCVLDNQVRPQLPTLALAERDATEVFLKQIVFFANALGYDFFTPPVVTPPPPPEPEVPKELQGIISEIRDLVVPLEGVEVYTTKTPDWRAKVTVGDTFRVFIRAQFRKGRVRLGLTELGKHDVLVGQHITSEMAAKIKEARDKAVAYLSAKATEP